LPIMGTGIPFFSSIDWRSPQIFISDAAVSTPSRHHKPRQQQLTRTSSGRIWGDDGGTPQNSITRPGCIPWLHHSHKRCAPGIVRTQSKRGTAVSKAPSHCSS
jgi:hypothetical protein